MRTRTTLLMMAGLGLTFGLGCQPDRLAIEKEQAKRLEERAERLTEADPPVENPDAATGTSATVEEATPTATSP